MPELTAVGRWVRNPGISLATLAEGGKQIQLGWLQIARGSEASGPKFSSEQRERAMRTLRDLADVLELHEMFCAFLEAEESLGFSIISNVQPDQFRRAVEMVRALTGLNPVEVVKRGERFVPKPGPADQDKSSALSWKDIEETLLRMSASALSACNLKMVEETAAQIGRNPLAHRCRVACEWLRLFLFRRGADQGKQVRAAGEAYAQGRLSLEEVASIVGVSRDEAIFLLERYGYFRPAPTIRLDTEDRKTRLARLRADRMRRNGVPSLDKNLVMRDVVASQRIEDLDARPWLLTTPPTQQK